MSLFTCRQVSMAYEGRTVLSGIDFSVNTGDYLGIIGENGAGKSTMFGMLTDNLRPDKGSITADGEDIYKMGADYRAKIGYMPQQQSLYEAFTAEKLYLIHI